MPVVSIWLLPSLAAPTVMVRYLSGHTFADAPPFLLVASNLTQGVGGVGGSYSDTDWVRAIRAEFINTLRTGRRPDGTAL
ncbi:MAG: hypothetical protein U0175_18685 [Caldilineaceae bacterium]